MVWLTDPLRPTQIVKQGPARRNILAVALCGDIHH